MSLTHHKIAATFSDRKRSLKLTWRITRGGSCPHSVAGSPLERRHPIVSAQQEMIDSSDEDGVWM
jgi:hypothetical protein